MESGDYLKRTLYLNNLHEKVDCEIIRDLLINAGPLEEVKLMTAKDVESGKIKTFSHVTYKFPESVGYAILVFRDVTLFGNHLQMTPAFKKRKRSLESAQSWHNEPFGKRPKMDSNENFIENREEFHYCQRCNIHLLGNEAFAQHLKSAIHKAKESGLDVSIEKTRDDKQKVQMSSGSFSLSFFQQEATNLREINVDDDDEEEEGEIREEIADESYEVVKDVIGHILDLTDVAIEFNAKIRNTVFGRFYCSECHVGFFVKDMYDNHLQSPEHLAKEFLNKISSATSTSENEYSIELNSVKNAILNIDKDKPGKGGKKRKFPKGMRNNQKPKLGNANLVPIGQPSQSKKKKMTWNSQGKKFGNAVNNNSQNHSASPQNILQNQLQNAQQTQQNQHSQPKANKKPKKRNRNRTKKPNVKIPNVHLNPQFYQRQIFPTSYYPQYEYVPYPNMHPPGPPYRYLPGQGYGYFPNFPPGIWGNW